MDTYLIFVAAGAFGAIAFAISRIEENAWGEVAADLGLGYSKEFLGTKSLRGRLRGFDVEVTKKAEKGSNGIVAEVHGVDPGFTLGSDSALQRMVKADIETGDGAFDERIRVEGDAGRALAVLHEEARRLTQIIVDGNHGNLDRRTLRSTFHDIQQAGSKLERMLDLAQHLQSPRDEDLPALLAERALHDPLIGVRLQAFRQLSSMPRSEQVVATAEKLIATPSADLRLQAAKFLLHAGPKWSSSAAEVLVGLARRHQVDSQIRRSALEELTTSPRHRVSAIPTMREILFGPGAKRPGVRRAALDGLIRAKASEDLLEFQPVGAAEAEALARGLGQLDISVQPRLVQLLEHSEDRVRRAAIDSLKRVGDVDAVAALRQVAGKKALLKSSLARAAEEAIAQIKNRSDGSQRGEISLVALTPLEGAVSQADESETGGEVSLTP